MEFLTVMVQMADMSAFLGEVLSTVAIVVPLLVIMPLMQATSGLTGKLSNMTRGGIDRYGKQAGQTAKASFDKSAAGRGLSARRDARARQHEMRRQQNMAKGGLIGAIARGGTRRNSQLGQRMQQIGLDAVQKEGDIAEAGETAKLANQTKTMGNEDAILHYSNEFKNAAKSGNVAAMKAASKALMSRGDAGKQQLSQTLRDSEFKDQDTKQTFQNFVAAETGTFRDKKADIHEWAVSSDAAALSSSAAGYGASQLSEGGGVTGNAYVVGVINPDRLTDAAVAAHSAADITSMTISHDRASDILTNDQIRDKMTGDQVAALETKLTAGTPWGKRVR